MKSKGFVGSSWADEISWISFIEFCIQLFLLDETICFCCTMPTVDIKRDLLFKAIGKEYSKFIYSPLNSTRATTLEDTGEPTRVVFLLFS